MELGGGGAISICVAKTAVTVVLMFVGVLCECAVWVCVYVCFTSLIIPLEKNTTWTSSSEYKLRKLILQTRSPSYHLASFSLVVQTNLNPEALSDWCLKHRKPLVNME